MNKIYKIKAEFKDNDVECCFNKSVKEALNNIPIYEDAEERILNILSKYKDYNKVSKRVSCLTPLLFKAEIFNSNDKTNNILHLMNNFISEVHNNYYDIRTGDYIDLPNDYTKQLAEYVNIIFDETFLRNNTDEPLFKKEWSVYNEAVNFEHVCFVIACMLINVVEIKQNQIYSQFLYFLEKYDNNKQLMKYFIYHYMKLIRIYYTTSADNEKKFFNPKIYMTSLNFGSYMDPNVEIYGDIRIMNKKDELLNLFSYAPRTPADSNELALWINWNELTYLVRSFGKNSDFVWNRIFVNNSDKKYTNIYNLFKLLTTSDILPRKKYVDEKIKNYYHRCNIEKMPNDDELYALIANIASDYKIKTATKLQSINKLKIGITYINKGKVVSELTNITYEDLINNLNNKADPPKGIEIKTYSVDCHIDDGKIYREEE